MMKLIDFSLRTVKIQHKAVSRRPRTFTFFPALSTVSQRFFLWRSIMSKTKLPDFFLPLADASQLVRLSRHTFASIN